MTLSAPTPPSPFAHGWRRSFLRERLRSSMLLEALKCARDAIRNGSDPEIVLPALDDVIRLAVEVDAPEAANVIAFPGKQP